MFLLDTNVVSAFVVQGNENVRSHLIATRRADRYVCPITVAECLRGVARMRRSGEWPTPKARRVESLYVDFFKTIQHFDEADDRLLQSYVEIWAALTNEGRRIEDNDLWIAACAHAYGATLVTADGHFERVAQLFGVRVEDWAKHPRPKSRRR